MYGFGPVLVSKEASSNCKYYEDHCNTSFSGTTYGSYYYSSTEHWMESWSKIYSNLEVLNTPETPYTNIRQAAEVLIDKYFE